MKLMVKVFVAALLLCGQAVDAAPAVLKLQQIATDCGPGSRLTNIQQEKVFWSKYSQRLVAFSGIVRDVTESPGGNAVIELELTEASLQGQTARVSLSEKHTRRGLALSKGQKVSLVGKLYVFNDHPQQLAMQNFGVVAGAIMVVVDAELR